MCPSVRSHLQFEGNGFAVIENFLSEKEADEMNEIGFDMARNAPENTRKIVHSSKERIQLTFLNRNFQIFQENICFLSILLIALIRFSC